jgi:hypothetical protein
MEQHLTRENHQKTGPRYNEKDDKGHDHGPGNIVKVQLCWIL